MALAIESRFRTLRAKLLLVLVGCIVIPGGAVTTIIWAQQEMLRNEIREHRLVRLRDAIAAQEEKIVVRVISFLDKVGERYAQNADFRAAGDPDENLLITDARYLTLGVMEADGRLRVIAGDEPSPAAAEVIAEITQDQATVVRDVPDRAGMVIVVRSMGNDLNERLRAGFAVLDAQSMRGAVAEVLNRSVGAWVLLDRVGRVIEKSDTFGQLDIDPAQIQNDWERITVETTAARSLILGGQYESFRHDAAVLHAFFPPLSSFADRPIRQLGLIAVGALAVAVLLSLGIWFLVSSYFTRELRKLLGTVDEMFPELEGSAAVKPECPSEFDFLHCRLSVLAEMLRRYRLAAEMENERLAGQIGVLRQVARREGLDAALEDLCHFVEGQTPGSRCSVLILDRDGRTVVRSVAPSLPAHYNAALIGLRIGPDVGSCGAAMSMGSPVFVDDIATHPNWAPFRELALPCGLRACWSLPAIREDGWVLGAFAIYKLAPGMPSPDEIQIASMGVELAVLAIDHHKALDLLERQALRDELTNLPNRRYLYDWLARSLASKEASAHLAGGMVLLLDLDEFKPVNDTYGHAAGDAVLREVGKRLSQMLREGDVVARLGGDEFAIVAHDIAAGGTGDIGLCERIIRRITAPISLDGGNVVQVSCSIGIALFPDDADSATELLCRADEAMYAAKERGKNCSVFWRELAGEARFGRA